MGSIAKYIFAIIVSNVSDSFESFCFLTSKKSEKRVFTCWQKGIKELLLLSSSQEVHVKSHSPLPIS